MSHPYARNYLHLVFSTKDRCGFIKPELQNDLYVDLRRVDTDYGISLDAVGGTEIMCTS